SLPRSVRHRSTSYDADPLLTPHVITWWASPWASSGITRPYTSQVYEYTTSSDLAIVLLHCVCPPYFSRIVVRSPNRSRMHERNHSGCTPITSLLCYTRARVGCAAWRGTAGDERPGPALGDVRFDRSATPAEAAPPAEDGPRGRRHRRDRRGRDARGQHAGRAHAGRRGRHDDLLRLLRLHRPDDRTATCGACRGPPSRHSPPVGLSRVRRRRRWPAPRARRVARHLAGHVDTAGPHRRPGHRRGAGGAAARRRHARRCRRPARDVG